MGLHFNPAIRTCDWPEMVPCTKQSSGTASDTSEIVSQIGKKLRVSPGNHKIKRRPLPAKAVKVSSIMQLEHAPEKASDPVGRNVFEINKIKLGGVKLIPTGAKLVIEF